MKYFLSYLILRIFDWLFFRGKLLGVPVIFYHSISDGSSKISVSPAVFAKQMEYLARRGCQTILPQDLNKDIFSRGEKKFLIIFDDGFRDVYLNARPVMDRLNFKASVFISTDYIGGNSIYASDPADKTKQIMSPEEIKELEDEGWCIANHFSSHRNLTQLSKEEISSEYLKAKDVLKSIINNNTADIVVYPYNRYNRQVISVLKESGARLAFSGGDRVYYENDDIFAIPRLEVNREVNFYKFRLLFSPSFCWLKNLRKRL